MARPAGRAGAQSLYENSLSSGVRSALPDSPLRLHATSGSARVHTQEQLEHGRAGDRCDRAIVGTAQFWFESFQNWQSEFLSLVAMVVLSIFLRQTRLA